MTALLCSILCASLVNIGLAFAGRRGWDSRPVLLAAYLASALLAGALLASARPALCWPGPGCPLPPGRWCWARRWGRAVCCPACF